MANEKPLTSSHVVLSLSERDLEDAKRILTRLVLARERRSISEGAHNIDPHRQEISEDECEVLARRMFAVRKARLGLLPERVSGEPSWDILLALYLSDTAGACQTVSRIVEFSRSSLTTGLRHITSLEEAGLVRRERNETDRRIFYVFITAKGSQMIRQVLSNAIRA